jgi:hypothetical protein
LRDKFGFNRLLIILTKSGKLFCIQTKNGEILWSSFHQGLTHFHINHHENLIIGIMKDNSIITLNSLNGNPIIEREKLKFQVLAVSSMDSNLLFIDSHKNIHFLKANQTLDKPFYFQELKEKEIIGYSLSQNENVRKKSFNL